MQVILLEKLGKRGNLGDVVTVKDGHARNLLLPQSKALRATPANLKMFEAHRAQIEARNAKARSIAEAQAEVLRNQIVIIEREISPSGQVYGSVSARNIWHALAEDHGARLEPSNVLLPYKIKEAGRHIVRIELHPEVDVHVEVIVARTSEDAATIGYAGLDPYERRDRAMDLLTGLAATAAERQDATSTLLEAAMLADEQAGHSAREALKSNRSSAFQESLDKVFRSLDVNCLVAVRGHVDPEDTSLIHMHMNLHGALPTRLGNDRTFRLMWGDVMKRAELELQLYASDAATVEDPGRETQMAPDGDLGRITVRKTLKRLEMRSESTEVWAMGHVNGACVHRRVWTFA